MSAAATRSPGATPSAARPPAAERVAHEQLRVADALLAVDDRERLGVPLGTGQQVLAEIHDSLPATSAIASTIAS